jgi:hypothetical protein
MQLLFVLIGNEKTVISVKNVSRYPDGALLQGANVNDILNCFFFIDRAPKRTFAQTGEEISGVSGLPDGTFVYLLTKTINFGTLWRALEWKMLVYFTALWYILWSFEIFYGHLVYFVAIWYTYFVVI